jgi:hypothetical protein
VSEEAEIRRDLEQAIGRLPDAVWDDLIESNVIQMHLEGHLELDDSEKSWEVVKEEAKKRVRFLEKGISEVLEGGEPPEDDTYDEGHGGEWRWVPQRIYLEESSHESTEAERLVAAYYEFLFHVGSKSSAMQRATSAYFGWLASQHPRVVQFCDRVLGERTLTPDEARKLIGSYAARYFPLEWFLDWKIPIVEHTSEIMGEYDWGSHRDEVDHRVTVRVDPPGIIERVRYAHPDAPLLDESENQISSRCVLMKKRRGVIPPFEVSLPEDPEEGPPPEDLTEVKLADDPEERSVFLAPLVLSGNYQTSTRPTSVWPGSVVGDLYVLAEELVDTFCWPGKDAAARFVLTGLAPLMRPINARLYEENGFLESPLRIQLDASPWVSEEEVSGMYRRMQEHVIQGRNRLPGAKTLRVTNFVWSQKRKFGYDRLPWSELHKQWNKENSDDQIKSHSNLRTYYLRGAKAVKELNFSRFMFGGGPQEE